MVDKFCTDCVFSSDEGSTPRHPAPLWGCRNERAGSRINVVDGKRMLVRCESTRAPDGNCGPDGKYWQRKEGA